MALVKNQTEVTNSTIGENSYFNGKFFINGSLKIDGKFEGKSLQAEHLYIGVTGKVKTNITAASVIVEGIIVGNVTARNRVMFLPTSKILGDIKTPELIIQNGVILEGRCMISNDLKHSAKDLIELEYSKDSLSVEKIFGKQPNAKE
ncbi:polymer-forming cytoskeletal family protein [Leptospira yanagawae serovar Saopaulo str. Sao Paulo = ATCC 700523]|uniref:Polymer-forming cytoskeletal family protein n=1 Tax=Leptospira yanagawae serovar Saopaulo str. Sao Paulo = ATCC 700523 TaxID=1249483 RepID=A0A5E8HHK7_9LEPT|nr:polymer-forming cytoskeletal protein [Leptospira yanagawae]EOQ90337.1 polymer-forming cytoskeletal family protein [Leptospira yanagawae serovar Saopaulo str. Sao Paulo = ATCC 700523]